MAHTVVASGVACISVMWDSALSRLEQGNDRRVEIWIGFCHRFKQPFDKQFFGGPSSSARRHRLFIVGVCSRGHFRLACVLHQSECGVRKTLCPTTPISYLISPQSNYAVWEDVAAELMAATSEFVAP